MREIKTIDELNGMCNDGSSGYFDSKTLNRAMEGSELNVSNGVYYIFNKKHNFKIQIKLTPRNNFEFIVNSKINTHSENVETELELSRFLRALHANEDMIFHLGDYFLDIVGYIPTNSELDFDKLNVRILELEIQS